MTRASFVDAKNRLYLMLSDVINYSDVISAADSWGCTFHWCIDCGKYSCLICQGLKLLGWPSYDQLWLWVFTINTCLVSFYLHISLVVGSLVYAAIFCIWIVFTNLTNIYFVAFSLYIHCNFAIIFEYPNIVYIALSGCRCDVRQCFVLV